MTVVSVCDSIAHLAASTSLAAGSISGYRSSLRSLWFEHAAPGAPSPTDDELVGKVIAGIKKERAMRKALTPATISPRDPAAVTLSFSLLETMHPRFGSDDPESMLIWASLCTGTAGLLRPGEVVGPHLQPYRALHIAHVVFYGDAGRHMPLAVGGWDKIEGPTPRGKSPLLFTLNLRVTKADPLAENLPHPVGHPLAVLSLWRWMHRRAALYAAWPGPRDPEVFRLPGTPLLTRPQLVRAQEAAVSRALERPVTLCGRSMRRGGASSLMAAGVSGSAMMEAGRWASPSMPVLYASAESKETRKVVNALRHSV